MHFLDLAEASFAQLISSSTLFAIPRERGSASLLDLARAFACGVPALAVDSVRTRSLLAHDEHGLLVSGSGLEAWTEALRRGASSPEARKRWGRAARRLAEETFSWSAVATNFETSLRVATTNAADPARVAPGSAAHAARG